MKIVEKINLKQDMYGQKPVTIAFLGDSVTHGCFECYIGDNDSVETELDIKNAYSTHIRELLGILYPSVPVNIINGGISGDNASGCFRRIDRDILPYSPDLVVLSCGLNDSGAGPDGLEEYKQNIRAIIEKLQKEGIEVIFLTQNYMNTKVSCHLPKGPLTDVASGTMQIQLNGFLKEYMDSAKEIAKELGAGVCDLYSIWEKWNNNGVDTTELLANKINHPKREIHYYMAIKLIETMFEI